MSRYAHEHPEQFEPGGEGFDSMFDRPLPPLQPCVACGEPTRRGRWCSESCRRAEDGLSADEAYEMEQAHEREEDE